MMARLDSSGFRRRRMGSLVADSIKCFIRYLGWRDACINCFNPGRHSTISIALYFCVVQMIKILCNAKLFQSLLSSERDLQSLLFISFSTRDRDFSGGSFQIALCFLRCLR